MDAHRIQDDGKHRGAAPTVCGNDPGSGKSAIQAYTRGLFLNFEKQARPVSASLFVIPSNLDLNALWANRLTNPNRNITSGLLTRLRPYRI
jgi:hypothetical protein